MVATVRSVSSAGNAARYFYFIENNFECSRGWCNTLAQDNLGLDELERRVFEEILNGQITERNENNETIITQLGRKTEQGVIHHPGQELILSAPKSVSIMGLVAEDDRVLEAHEKAVDEIVRYLERTMVYTRVQKHGEMQLEHTNNILAAKFTHLTSRPSISNQDQNQKEADPQIHTHVIIPNATKCRDGVWRSIVFDELYANKMHLGELYRMELAQNLQKLGYDIRLQQDRSKHWTFEIGSVPQEEIEKFSRRRQDILQAAEELGVHDAESMALIAKSTREEKVTYNIEELRASWQERSRSFVIPIGITATETKTDKKLNKALDYSIEHLSERESSWKKEDLIAKIITKEGFQYTLAEIERGIEKYLATGKLLQGYNSLTTSNNLQAEQQCIDLLQRQSNTVNSIADILPNIDGLSVGQQDAIALVFQTNDRIVGIQGSAGTGKTTVLNNIRDLAANHGYQILGLSPTKSAAKNIEDATKIKSQTLQLFLATYAGVIEGRGTEVGREKMRQEYSNKIVVLDEASLASTKQMSHLLHLAEVLKFRLVLMGDSKQLGSVEAGKPFYYCQEHGLNTALMNSIKRQQNKSLLEAVYAVEKGIDKINNEARSYITKGLKALGKDNIIDVAHISQKEIVTNKDIAEAVYNKWKSYQNKDVLIVVPSNPLRKEINLKIRNIYTSGINYDHVILVNKDLSRIDKMEITSYNIGDTIVFNKDNSKHNIIKNSYWTVQDKTENELVLVDAKENIIAKINPKDVRGGIEVYTTDMIQLAAGERIRWTKNSKEHDFMINGNSAIITNISDNKIEVKTQDGITKILHSKNLKHIDYDYSSTTYSVQSKTIDHVIGVVKAKELYLKLSTQRALYVKISRARHSVTLVVDHYKNLIQGLAKKTGSKSSALEQMNPDYNKATPKIRVGREVFISQKKDKNIGLESSIHSISKPDTQYRSYHETDLRSKAIEMFGEINGKLSRNNQLRFGKKGSVAVNLNTGQWYDFESGTGGSIKPKVEYFYDSPKITRPKVVSTKSYNIDKLVQNSVSINNDSANLGKDYLQNHRGLDLSKINLSANIRYSSKIWNSEIKYHAPGLVAAAQNSSGETKALQIIYLDPHTSNKRNDLAVVKKTIGELKGAFVELTSNKNAKNIFIAEGIETALSIAEAQPKAHILCSLGVSNMHNIALNFRQDITVIICADNDGANGASKSGIERAAHAYKALGAGTVAVIRPKIEGQDFNDVLKQNGAAGINAYIEPLLAPNRCYKNQISDVKNQVIKYQKEKEKLEPKVGDGVYKKKIKALANWRNLVVQEGIKKANIIVKNKPEILGELEGLRLLGINSNMRQKAIAKSDKTLKELMRLITVQKLIKLKQKTIQKAEQDFGQKHLKHITRMETKSLNYNELRMKLEMELPYILKASDNIIDIMAVQRVAKQITEKIINYRETYKSEPNAEYKKEYFYDARFAENERNKLAEELAKTVPNKTNGEKIVFNQKLEHLSVINSSLSDKSSEFYVAESQEKVIAKFREKTEKITALTKEYIASGSGKIKAHFMATEVVKYEDKFGAHMPAKMRNQLDRIGDYVSENHAALVKSGFSIKEARMTYDEGCMLMLNKSDVYNIKTNVKQAQQQSKQQFEAFKSEHHNVVQNHEKIVNHELEM